MDEREAFVAMSRFVWQFANRAGDDLLTLLGDIGIEADGGTTDPAAWNDRPEYGRQRREGERRVLDARFADPDPQCSAPTQKSVASPARPALPCNWIFLLRPSHERTSPRVTPPAL